MLALVCKMDLAVVRLQCYVQCMKIISVRDIAALVKQERKKRGWTQAELAMRSGVSRDWIIALEKAKPTLELGLVLRAVKALGIRLDASSNADNMRRIGSERGIDSLVAPDTSRAINLGKDTHSVNSLNEDEAEYS